MIPVLGLGKLYQEVFLNKDIPRNSEIQTIEKGYVKNVHQFWNT